MTTMSPTEMAQRLGGGLQSFPVTHFDADGAFVEDEYRKHCTWMLEYELSGLFAAGGTGEFFSLTPAEVAQVACYTYVTSNIQYLTSATGGASVTAPLIGLSKHAANGTLYFETAKFQIRGSIAYRSRYLTAVPGTEGNAFNGTSDTTNVDAQMSYNLTDNFKFGIEAINLTDQVNDQFVDESNRLNVLTHSGRQFTAGVRFSF